MIFAYIYDFISFLFEKDLRREIKNIIVYGSIASGEFDEESDIDIFIGLWNKNNKAEVEKKVKEQLSRFEEIAARLWHPRGINNHFSIIIDELGSSRWENLKEDMISNGLMLYGKFEDSPKKMQHMALFTFSLSKLKQPQKMKFIRAMYGYGVRKTEGKKASEKEGLLGGFGGIKVSQNSILVPIEKIKEFRKLFSEFKISPQVREVWTR